MAGSLWQQCLAVLKEEVSPQNFSMWLRPLQAQQDDGRLVLYASNRFILDWVRDNYLERVRALLSELAGNQSPKLQLEVGSPPSRQVQERAVDVAPAITRQGRVVDHSPGREPQAVSEVSELAALRGSGINNDYVFDNFVEGKSNQLAKAAAQQVAQNPGAAYNPLFVYGSTGLGKTHLLHAVGNAILERNPKAKVVYMRSERFVQDMVKALQKNQIDEFKAFYRSADVLLIDDIQFFAGKERSQEEFFHTFNALLEGNHQVILTSDRYPKEINGVEERLKSRFGWGLTIMVEPPELETRVAILKCKAEEKGIDLPDEVAFFVAKRLRSNVRELEGALNRIIANANFTGRPITIDFAKDSLRDLLALQEKLVTIENIQRTVAEYYKIKLQDLLSKRRSRSVARPRQMAMALSKELTNHSLPEIGDAFGGRDHTTVLHACRKIESLRDESHDIQEDYTNLIRILSS